MSNKTIRPFACWLLVYLPLIGSAETLVINGVAHKPDEFRLCPVGKGVTIELAPGAYTFEQK